MLFSIFRFCENCYTDSKSLWSDLLVNFLGAFVGAVFGFISAYIIFRIQTNKTIRHEEEKFQKELHQHFRFMIELVEDSLSTAKEQTNKIKRYISLLQSDPFNIHEIELLLFTEVNRILKFESEYTYKSFLTHVPDNINKYNAYKNVFNCIDYLNKTYIQINDSYDKHCDRIYAKQLKFKVVVDDLANLIGLVLKNNDSTLNPDLDDFLDSMLTMYMDLSTKSKSIIDYEDKILHTLREKILKEYRNSPELEILLLKARQAGTILNDIEYESLGAVEFLNTIISKYSEVIDKLNRQIIDIK